MSLLYLSGRSHQYSNDELFLKDQLDGMGNAITSDIGSLAWIEATVLARSFVASLNFLQLLSNQLSPNSISVYADRFARIYGLNRLGNGDLPTNLHQIQSYIGIKTASFGTAPTYSNIYQYISAILGQIFIGLEYIDYHNQSLSTTGPLSAGSVWSSQLSSLFVRVWQPRDNQDNSLMSNADFTNKSVSYKAFVLPWMPADIAINNMQLLYAGANALPAYGISNTISGSAGTNTIVGTTTTFNADFGLVAVGYQMPIEVVADNNKLYTYHITSVNSDTSLTTLETITASFTARTYRCLGIQMDVSGALDNMLFNI